jgi:hypothetical protein
LYCVKTRAFAWEKRGDGSVSVWFRVAPDSQQELISADPEIFFLPPNSWDRDWVGMRLDRNTDWQRVAPLIRTSYRLVAPKRLAARVPD